MNLGLIKTPISIHELVERYKLKLSTPYIKKTQDPLILIAGCGTANILLTQLDIKLKSHSNRSESIQFSLCKEKNKRTWLKKHRIYSGRLTRCGEIKYKI